LIFTDFPPDDGGRGQTCHLRGDLAPFQASWPSSTVEFRVSRGNVSTAME
jgi:hypothetical protein